MDGEYLVFPGKDNDKVEAGSSSYTVGNWYDGRYIIIDEQGNDSYSLHRPGIMQITDTDGENDYSVSTEAIQGYGRLEIQGDLNPESRIQLGNRVLTINRLKNHPYIYDAATGTLTISMERLATPNAQAAVAEMAEAETAATVAAVSPFTQRAGLLELRDFRNGMFGITGIAGAPTLGEPDPEPQPQPGHQLFLPLIRQERARTTAADITGEHPLHAARPEVTAVVGQPEPAQMGVDPVTGLAMSALYGSGALLRWQGHKPVQEQSGWFRQLRAGMEELAGAVGELGEQLAERLRRADQRLLQLAEAHDLPRRVEAWQNGERYVTAEVEQNRTASFHLHRDVCAIGAVNPQHLDRMQFFLKSVVAKHQLQAEIKPNLGGEGFTLYITPPDAEAGFSFTARQELTRKASFHLEQMGLQTGPLPAIAA